MTLHRWIAGARFLALIAATLVIAAVVWAVSVRIGFALELEWMEGGSLQQARRFQHGLALYPAPSADFIPFLYTPLYPVVLGVLGHVFPLDYALGRAVSVVAVMAAAGALWLALAQEGRPHVHRWLGIGLFAAGYVFTFRWLDLARADSLALALLAWAAVLLRRALLGRVAVVWSSILFALAFWTKQTAAPFIMASGVAVLGLSWRQRLVHVATIAVIDGGGVLLGNALSDGWLWTYIYELHQSHRFNRLRFTRKSWGMLAHAAPFVLAGMVAWTFGVLLRARAIWGSRGPTELRSWVRGHAGIVYWGGTLTVALVVSALGYSTQYAEANAFIPGVYFGAVFVALILPVGGRGELAGVLAVTGQLLFSLALEPAYHVVQRHGLARLGRSYRWQDPWRSMPTAAQRERAVAFRAELEALHGSLFATHRPWWNVVAGGSGHAGRMGINDVPPAMRRKVMGEVRQRLRNGEYDAVWVEGAVPAWLASELNSGRWRLELALHGDQRVLPLTGYMSPAGMIEPFRRPQQRYRRRK